MFFDFPERASTVEKLRAALGKVSTAEVLRLHAPSALSRDKSVGRSAQNDDFAGALTKNILNKSAFMEKLVTQ
jgi:hypothetical protein